MLYFIGLRLDEGLGAIRCENMLVKHCSWISGKSSDIPK